MSAIADLQEWIEDDHSNLSTAKDNLFIFGIISVPIITFGYVYMKSQPPAEKDKILELSSASSDARNTTEETPYARPKRSLVGKPKK